MLKPLSSHQASDFRQFLRDAGYTHEEFRSRSGFKDINPGSLPFLLEYTREPNRLNTLLRLFLLGVEVDPAIVRETADDHLLRDALLENIHRVQLNPLEEAAAYQQLLDEFGVTHDELAARIGRSRPLISNMIRLLRLPIAVQRRVAAGVLSAGHARALLALDGGPEAQEELAARIVAEGLSVRATEEAVTLANRSDAAKPGGPRRKPIHMPGLQDVAERLSSAYDTRVTVSLGKRKGKIVVEFGSVDDLQRIVGLMDAGGS